MDAPERIHRIFRSTGDLLPDDIQALYAAFDAPVADVDCGRMCAPHNSSGAPFCCDICHAVPAVYSSEWEYLQAHTTLWHRWRGNECADERDPMAERRRLEAGLAQGMTLLACRGAAHCERPFRALACRQFPFFPYVSADYRFLGLAGEWAFESVCWVLQNPERVSPEYRGQFVAAFDSLFALFQEVFDSYAEHSDWMRRQFTSRRRRFLLLHRNGRNYLVSPGSGRLTRVAAFCSSS